MGFTAPTRGFTLLELMVALAVLAVVSIAVLGRGGDAAYQLHGLEERTLARWVAENEIAKLRLGRRVQAAQAGRGAVENDGGEAGQDAAQLASSRSLVTYGERTWRVVVEADSTTHPLLQRVEVSVFAAGEGGTTTAANPTDILTAFVGLH